jgi:hypothetical protein
MNTKGPRPLRRYLAAPSPEDEMLPDNEVDAILDRLLSEHPNDEARLRFSHALRSWDNAKAATWDSNTPRNTEARRKLILSLLAVEPALAARINAALPFYRVDEPTIIAKEHVDWYEPKPGVDDYYWHTYHAYLKQRKGWHEVSLLTLDNTTRAIVECLANPRQEKTFASRGLVMGYVQSGKTANFVGVAARAADAGYRLIIVLAGTWNILRDQTQRRFDKELLGKELLLKDEAYTEHKPSDWDEFLEHGQDPAALDHFVWQRLTRPDIDYKRLKAAIDNLAFEKRRKDLPLYHEENLKHLPVKLLIVKKHSEILKNLTKDLALVDAHLTELPALIIDDESDQASVNTQRKRVPADAASERSKVNKRIVALLQLLPRAQYVGYTATPYANALVDVTDEDDLFPRDFIVSLERPQDYMGVSDFFDATTDYSDLDSQDYSLPEIAYIRRVATAATSDDEELKTALRSYVIAGALKLYRLASDRERYKPDSFKHHTMLVHTSHKVGAHAVLVERLKGLWFACGFHTPDGLSALRTLWCDDYELVCRAQGNELIPDTFDSLIPHLATAIAKIELGQKVFLEVNHEAKEAPDFITSPVWKVIVGGNKLSRGYTIEGLTVSYYRRVSKTADTLMQMGRWFGFRPGYRDLVRVFLGVVEGKSATEDLVSLFKEVCRMEEGFREEIKRYRRVPGAPRITPKDIPPLIAVTGNLLPTQKNKMWNAILAQKNFGGQRSMLTLAASTQNGINANLNATSRLLDAGTVLGTKTLGGKDDFGQTFSVRCAVVRAASEDVATFIEDYWWLEADYAHPKRPAVASLQVEFLRREKHGIAEWLILAPQRIASFGTPLPTAALGPLTVKERQRDEGRGFKVFGEPYHRLIAEALAGIQVSKRRLAHPNAATRGLLRDHVAVMLLYPVREASDSPLSIGFELYFPVNDLPYGLSFTAHQDHETDAVVIDTEEDAA